MYLQNVYICVGGRLGGEDNSLLKGYCPNYTSQNSTSDLVYTFVVPFVELKRGLKLQARKEYCGIFIPYLLTETKLENR